MMNTNRKLQILPFFMAICTMGIMGCATDDKVTERSSDLSLLDAGGFKFSLTMEDFCTDTAMTRTTLIPFSQTQSISDDCEAEIFISADSTKKSYTKTRSIPLQDGVYSIVAFQGNIRKGKITGTISGGGTIFTPLPNTPAMIRLSHGTYTFVCFNDKVEDDGTDIKVLQANAGTAMVGVAKDYVINQDPNQYVPFVMKHVGARIRIKFAAQKHIPSGIKAKVNNNSPVPITATFNPTVANYAYANGTSFFATEYSYPASDNATQPLYSYSNYGENYSYTSENTDGYCYVLPTTDASNLKLDFSSGKMFRQPMNGKTLHKLMTASYPFMPNQSYCITVKMSPVYTYLFHDGTTGTLKNKGTRKPIALVVKDNDGTPNSGLAVGLYKSSQGSCWINWPDYDDPEGGRCFNANQYTVFDDAYNTANGYEETWTPVFPVGKIKAEISTFVPIPSSAGVTGTWFGGDFFNAANFPIAVLHNQYGIDLTNGMENKKWFLPSLGEMKEALKSIGFFEESTITGVEQYGSWYSKLADKAFADVPGAQNFPAFGPNCYHTTTEYNKRFSYSIHFGFGGYGFFTPTPDKIFKIIRHDKYGGTGASRAFVHF